MSDCKNNKIDKFLLGQLAGDELIAFIQELTINSSLRGELSDESSLESILLQNVKVSSITPGIKSESDWIQTVIPEQSCKSDRIDTELSETEWNNIIESSFACAKNKLHLFPVMMRFLYAASLIAFIGGSFFFYMNQTSNEKNQRKIAANTSSSVDSIRLFDMSGNRTGTFAVSESCGVLLFGKKTGFLTEKNSRLTMKENRDTTVFLDLEKGSVLFDIEKGKYRKFIVNTPFAQIHVTGTIFRVTNGDGYVVVSVQNGSVIVKHSSKKLETTVISGAAILADKDTLTNLNIDPVIEIPKRRLLANFLKSSHIIDPVFGEFGHIVSGYDKLESSFLKSHSLLDSSTIQSTKLSIEGNYHRCMVLLHSADTLNAIQCFEESQDVTTNDSTFRDLILSFIHVYRKLKKVDNAEILMNQYYLGQNYTVQDEINIFEHAEFMRSSGKFKNALKWYEIFAEHFIHSAHKDDAVYWAGFCFIETQIEKNGKRASVVNKNLSGL